MFRAYPSGDLLVYRLFMGTFLFSAFQRLEWDLELPTMLQQKEMGLPI